MEMEADELEQRVSGGGPPAANSDMNPDRNHKQCTLGHEIKTHHLDSAELTLLTEKEKAVTAQLKSHVDSQRSEFKKRVGNMSC